MFYPINCYLEATFMNTQTTKQKFHTKRPEEGGYKGAIRRGWKLPPQKGTGLGKWTEIIFIPVPCKMLTFYYFS